jgi:hypothetical protein
MLPSIERGYVCERKFSGPQSALERAMAILECHCTPDDWFAEGVVNSIYFDTPEFSSYAEKANGDNLKMKLRLRWYGRDGELAPEVPAFLELKGRVGSARDKERIDTRVPRELVASPCLDEPALRAFLLANLERLEIPSPLSWRPVCRISYSRLRYFDTPTSSRVSLDWNIGAERINHALFPAAQEPLRLDSIVCEFKNHFGEPPAWAREMRIAGLSFGSFSKYGEIMSRLLDD